MLAKRFGDGLGPCDELTDARPDNGGLTVAESACLEGWFHGRQHREIAVRKAINQSV
jgi:hypothetical protein